MVNHDILVDILEIRGKTLNLINIYREENRKQKLEEYTVTIEI